MATLSQVTQTGIEVEIDGTKQTFPRLDGYDLAEIEDARKAKAKQRAEIDGKRLGLTLYDIYNLQADIDARELTVNEVLQEGRTPRGSIRILERSLAKAGVPAEQAKALIRKLDADEAVGVAVKVLMHNVARLVFDEAAKAAADEAVKNAQGASGTQTAVSPADSILTAVGSTTTDSTTATPSKRDDVPLAFGE